MIQNFLPLFPGQLSFSVLISLLTPPSTCSPPLSLSPQSPGSPHLGAGRWVSLAWYPTSHHTHAASFL